jgi:NAD(P)-dependent dehydrogenase (short-subunit alcohol dehydrogenase family)
MELAGAAALVTGGGVGLGRAVVGELAARGVRVALTYATSETEAHDAVSEVERTGSQALALRADVTNDAEVTAAIAEVVERFGALNVLVNNAGTTRWVPMAQLDAAADAIWQNLLDVNLVGAFRFVRAAAPALRQSGGSILNVASNSAFSRSGSSIPYVVSKAALISLTEVLAKVLAPDVRVNAIAPGWMDTQWLPRHIPAEVAEGLWREQPFVDVADIARIGVDLLANEAATGQTVVLDRGET